jgi:Cft2 family RNA processing exonuclease
MLVDACVDASFAVHVDGKGHTGVAITAGKGTIYAKSSKQKIMAKSSTEAELIGLTEGIAQVVWIRNFMIAQGYSEHHPATVSQDNKSAIIMTEKGRSTSTRTRHMAIKYFFAKDYLDRKEIDIRYVPTGDMRADLLTKPLQGKLFMKHRAALMNCDDENVKLEFDDA